MTKNAIILQQISFLEGMLDDLSVSNVNFSKCVKEKGDSCLEDVLNEYVDISEKQMKSIKAQISKIKTFKEDV